MDEKERRSLKERADTYSDNNPHSYRYDLESAYIQGALDQDPISRKAEREKILHAVISKHGHAPMNYAEKMLIDSVIRDIEALP